MRRAARRLAEVSAGSAGYIWGAFERLNGAKKRGPVSGFALNLQAP